MRIVRWHASDGDYNKEKDYPPLGAHNDKEYDEKYGRWWFQRKDCFSLSRTTVDGQSLKSCVILPKLQDFCYHEC